MNTENVTASNARLKQLEDRIDQMGEIVAECMETCERLLKTARGESQ